MRDSIAARFGLKAIGGFSGEQRDSVRAGDELDFFLVEHSAPNRLVLTSRDRHLDVMICLETCGHRHTIISSVVVQNADGRAYMVPVAPMHRLILAADLRRLRKSFGRETSRTGAPLLHTGGAGSSATMPSTQLSERDPC